MYYIKQRGMFEYCTSGTPLEEWERTLVGASVLAMYKVKN